jgi:hypothetical protein
MTTAATQDRACSTSLMNKGDEAIKRLATSAFVKVFGHGAMSGLSPSCASKQTSADQSEFMGSRPKLETGHARTREKITAMGFTP